MALSAAVKRTKGKVEIQKMRRLRPKVDTHFFNTTLAKRNRVWVMTEIVQMINEGTPLVINSFIDISSIRTL